MAGIRVVTDSACDLPPELARDHGILVVPLTIRFGKEELRDRVELAPDEFWQRCKSADALPETAAPSPGDFRAAFEQAADEGADAALCLTISAGVSATYQSALTAAEAAPSTLAVRVIDTRALSMGQGLLALGAAEAAAAGASAEEIADAVTEAMTRTRLYGALDTLEHLQRGGRIGGAAAWLGSMLSIKPVVEVREGVVEQESRQRTRGRSLEYLTNKVRQDAPLDRLAIINGAAADFSVLEELLSGIDVVHPVITTDLGPVVGTHSGPGTVAVCYQIAPR
jgi:DegV family protein with EDD domain